MTDPTPTKNNVNEGIGSIRLERIPNGILLAGEVLGGLAPPPSDGN